MLLLLSLFFEAFPDRKDAILSRYSSRVIAESSGSIGTLSKDSKCVITNPNNTMINDSESEWYSNIATNKDEPWISYFIPLQAMKLTGYSVRNGCDPNPQYCSENGTDYNMDNLCPLGLFSLEGSNNKKRWIYLHSISFGESLNLCESKTYKINSTDSYSFVRFIYNDYGDGGCKKFLRINQIELYGELVPSDCVFYSYEQDIDVNKVLESS